jgi:hypothetical protein
MAQQTAVEWLFDTLVEQGYFKKLPIEQYHKAKEMEKKQIINAAADHCYPTCESARTHAEQYYNETYGNEERCK